MATLGIPDITISLAGASIVIPVPRVNPGSAYGIVSVYGPVPLSATTVAPALSTKLDVSVVLALISSVPVAGIVMLSEYVPLFAKDTVVAAPIVIR